jgi:beta-galactosidase beta subunit
MKTYLFPQKSKQQIELLAAKLEKFFDAHRHRPKTNRYPPEQIAEAAAKVRKAFNLK